jgi:hypothetical protein
MYYLDLLRTLEETLRRWYRAWLHVIGFWAFFTGLNPPLLPPIRRVSCVARINNGIPPIENEQ